MSLLFIHDHKFRTKSGIFYSTGGLDDIALNRYTSIFGKMIVLARIIELSANEKLSEIKNPYVKIKNGWVMSASDLRQTVKTSDFIIVRLPSILGLKILPIIKKEKKPYLIEFVGDPWQALWNRDVVGKIVAPFFMLLNKNAVKKAPFVIYVTNKYLQNYYPTIGNSIGISDVALQLPQENILSDRIDKINSQGSVLTIGTCAAVNVRYKGQEYVIRALAELKKNGLTNFKYQLVGNGDNSYLKNIANKLAVSEHVEFMGGLPHEKVFDWLDTIDIYAQPSLQEGLPRAMIEAMSRALPCFGSRTAGIPELVDENVICKRKSVANIIEILEKFSLDKEFMVEQAKKNFENSLLYSYDLLETKRSAFFEKFMADSVVGKQIK